MDVAHFAAFVSGASSSSSADQYRDYYDSSGGAGGTGSGSGSGSGSDLFPSTVLIGADDPGLFAAYQVPSG